MVEKDIRRTRKQGNATILTVTGFLELDKFYELSKVGNVVEVHEVEMKVKS